MFVIGIDTGGTCTDISLVRQGAPVLSPEGIRIGHRKDGILFEITLRAATFRGNAD